METFLEILKFSIPAIVVGGVAYLVLKMVLDDNQKRRDWEYRVNNQKVITPLRLQAYERLIVFLERISPDSLIVRSQTSKMSAGRLHRDMIQLVNHEFEHNLSQQLYVSASAWIVIKNAKENTVKFINLVAGKVDAKAPAMELSKAIVDEMMQSGNSAASVAIDYLKKEVQKLF